jgi:hypothetical protein
MGEMVWLTDFPPPPGFDGYEKGEFTDFGYERECTLEEAELIEASAALEEAEERAREEQLRDAWFSALREQLNAAPGGHCPLDAARAVAQDVAQEDWAEPGSASASAPEEQANAGSSPA